jgi:class 3 adenylate cyclase/ABC-type nitrate/sulfonate/bicarbonate transport system substrate-binding protein
MARTAIGPVVVSLLALVGLVAPSPCWALDKVVLQLKWLHQFQFAGYYAAKEQGYYREAGLDVEVREGGPAIDSVEALEQGKADFGICTTNVLLRKPDQPKLVVLGVIFQHSPAVILMLSRAHVRSLSGLKGRRLMDAPGSDDIAAMLKHEGVDYASLPRVQHNDDPRDLMVDKADAMIAYSTNEPFVLDQIGVPYQTFSPRAFGYDFYGDALCTTAERAGQHPEQTRAFLAASIKGWKYALAHTDDIVRLILSRYSTKKTIEALLFEAGRTQALIQPQLIPLGSQTVERWQQIANSYHEIGLLADPRLPDGLIYAANSSEFPPWALPALIGLLGIVLVGSVVVFLYRQIVRNMRGEPAKPRLSLLMSAMFVGMSIPILIFILIYSYQRNSETILATLQRDVERSSSEAVESLDGMVQQVATVLRMLADAASVDPEYFRSDKSANTLYQALTSSQQIDAVYVSFEDGYHRVVTRIDDDRRKSDAKIPANANWHSSYIDDFSAKDNRRRHRMFFDTWGHLVGEYSVPSTMDIRTLPGYAEARDSETLVVSAPTINPDTGSPIVFVRFPIFRDGKFVGCASANITFDVLTRFLAANRASRDSRTIIADPNDGSIIATSDKREIKAVPGADLKITRLDDAADDELHEAYRHHIETSQDAFFFTSPRDGRQLSASFANFPNGYGRPWEAIVLTPTSDFVGGLQTTNERIIGVIVTLTIVELLLIYLLSRRLSKPIERVTRELASVEALDFAAHAEKPSRIREIAQLQTSVALLRNSLLSFSRFVPVDVVRGLIKSKIPLALGVETRPMTIFFSDLENFSTHAEQLAPDQLLQQMSVYFDQVSKAISDEKGSVDKFIGDGVMAFWGAPQPLSDHVIHGCRGALRAVRRMERVNEAWRAEGKPTFRTRIGLHTAQVLVGNVGSPERFSYTVMGDGVNVAARLEGLNKEHGTTICISDDVFEAVKAEIVARPLHRVRVKGRDQEFMVYELLGIAGSDDPELMPETRQVGARLSARAD